MDMGRFYDVMRWRTDTRAQYGAAMSNLVSARQELAHAAGGVTVSASNASFGEDVLAAADRLSNTSNALKSALQANAASIARTEKELEDVRGRERTARMAGIVFAVLAVVAVLVWIFH